MRVKAGCWTVRLPNLERYVAAGHLVAMAMVLFVALKLHAAEPYDTESELESRYGYLVIDTIVYRTTSNWRLDKTFVIDRLPIGRRTILVRLRAGSYHWQEIDVPYFDLPHRVDLADDERWVVTVKKQEINYAGTLIVGESRGSDSVSVRYINRSSEIVELLRENYTEHLQKYGITYSGRIPDKFFQLTPEGGTY